MIILSGYVYVYTDVTDYIWTSMMTFSFESFLENPPLIRTFDIPIVNDDEYEDVEYFLCEIMNTSLPGRFLIDQSRKQANVTITDDDCETLSLNQVIYIYVYTYYTLCTNIYIRI